MWSQSIDIFNPYEATIKSLHQSETEEMTCAPADRVIPICAHQSEA